VWQPGEDRAGKARNKQEEITSKSHFATAGAGEEIFFWSVVFSSGVTFLGFPE
jgi:hypothetical protein